MAKIKLGNIDPTALPTQRGRVYVRMTKHGPVMQAWPKKRKAARSGYDFYRQAEFGLAAKYAANAGPLDLYTATEMAKGTLQVPRDILQMAAYGYYYVFTLPDGQQMVPARTMTSNPQYILDLVTDEVGALLYRAPIGWVGLSPASDGWVLTLQDGLPIWKPGGGGSGGVPVWLSPDAQDGNHDGIGTRAVRFEPQETLQINAVAIEGHIQTSQRIYARVFEAADMTLGALLGETNEFTPTSTKTQDALLTLGSPVELSAGTAYWITVSDRSQTGAYNLRTNTTGGRWPGIILSGEPIGGRIDGNDPVQGNVLSGYGPKCAVRLQQIA